MYIILIINFNLYVMIYLILFYFGNKKWIVEMELFIGIVGYNILGFFFILDKKNLIIRGQLFGMSCNFCMIKNFIFIFVCIQNKIKIILDYYEVKIKGDVWLVFMKIYDNY